VFSTQDGGRWREFVWKDSGLNLLPENGALAGTVAAEVEEKPDGSLEFREKGGSRTVRLAGAALTVEQTTQLPPETLHTEKKNDIVFRVTRETPSRAVYSLERPAE